MTKIDDDQTSSSEKQLQAQRLRALIDLLIGAGYFRARVPALSDFDKVVGGLCWCIQSSGFDVDVDLWYDDTLTLGQKIRMAERVISVLRQMGCPSPLQANQVQGKDYNAVFPVVQWAVARVLEYRASTEYDTRRGAMSAFSSSFASDEVKTNLQTAYIKSVMDASHRLRRYKRSKKLWKQLDTTQKRVDACLLEYGEQPGTLASLWSQNTGPSATSDTTDKEFEKKLSAARKALGSEQNQAQEASQHAEKLLSMMSEKSASDKLSANRVGALLGFGSDVLADSVSKYQDAASALVEATQNESLWRSAQLGRENVQQRQINTLARKLEVKNLQATTTISKIQQREHDLRVIHSQLDESVKYNNKIRQETARLEAAAEENGKTDILRSTRLLVREKSTLEEKRDAFKSNCEQLLASLRADAIEIQNQRASSSTTAASQTLIEAEKQYAKATAISRKLTGALARRFKEVDKLRRFLDEVPSRPELLQYERRFMELYELMAMQLQELRKHLTVYNGLQQRKTFVQKENSLLDSIASQYSSSMKSKSSKESFAKQCVQLVNNLRQTVQSQSMSLQKKNATRESALQAYHAALYEDRMYARMLREFQAECVRNEQLVKSSH